MHQQTQVKDESLLLLSNAEEYTSMVVVVRWAQRGECTQRCGR
jgi:hypothetical protein